MVWGCTGYTRFSKIDVEGGLGVATFHLLRHDGSTNPVVIRLRNFVESVGLSIVFNQPIHDHRATIKDGAKDAGYRNDYTDPRAYPDSGFGIDYDSAELDLAKRISGKILVLNAFDTTGKEKREVKVPHFLWSAHDE